jgi:hypothetical protein
MHMLERGLFEDSGVKHRRPPMIGPLVVHGWTAVPSDTMRPVDVNKKYGPGRSQRSPLWAGNAAPAAKPPETRGKISGKHVPPGEAVVEATRTIDEIKAYQNKHQCTQRKALGVLYRELGHASPSALKQALQRSRKLLKRK